MSRFDEEITGECPLELSIVMPCLNEARTLGTCVRKARDYLDLHDVKGEVIVADNGSTDGSQAVAASLGAQVVRVASRGYGNALCAGIEAARSRFVIMDDSDDSYGFRDLDPFVPNQGPSNEPITRGAASRILPRLVA